MAQKHRRQFIAGSAAGAFGFAAVLANLSSDSKAVDEGSGDNGRSGDWKLMSPKTIEVRKRSTIHLRFSPLVDLPRGAKLWLFYDIRQDAKLVQTNDAGQPNLLTATVAGRDHVVRVTEVTRRMRTFDLYPVAPEFLNMVEFVFDQSLSRDEQLDIQLHDWEGPHHPIDVFQFWLVSDASAQWNLLPTGYKTYRRFVQRDSRQRVETNRLLTQTSVASVHVTGRYPQIPIANTRKTPGVYWGELHGMAFNQRPVDDFYNYAKEVTKLDFCCPCLFSYFTCVGDTWEQLIEAARRHTQPGTFVPIVGFECGTMNDDSHRKAHFPNPQQVPPIFCDSRPPAQEKFFQQRFHPDTIICQTLDEFYKTVRRYGGIVSGHFHTRTYDREILAEMWQKSSSAQVPAEQQRVLELMRQGKRFGLVGGSDTHDSMPGNPGPEQSLSRPAGFTGVWARELTTDAIFRALVRREVYATSGARILMKFDSNSRPMGSELPLDASRRFRVELDGTEELETVELLRDGRVIQSWTPGSTRFAINVADKDFDPAGSAFYLVRVVQTDRHQGWTSPIWFG